jgi:diguanylate cyclase (GGDEF)-like protein
MLGSTKQFLSARSPTQLALISLLIVAIVGTADHLTGYELSFSIFYLIPVALGSWYAGSRVGIFVCIISAATWFAVDYTSGHQYSHSSIPFWNAGVRTGFFVITAILLVRLRDALRIHASLAEQDGLTGLMNARTFHQRCTSVARLAARYGRPMAIGYLDLDGFKGVNDRLGHGVGDQLLRDVAAELVNRLRASDLVGRLGGDEFAVLLPETDVQGARVFFTEMRQGLVGLAADRSWPVGFSIGVAAFRSPPGTPEDAIRCADELMYEVKNTGKNDILLKEYAGEC